MTKVYRTARMFYMSEDEVAAVDALPATGKRTGRGAKIAALLEKPYHFTEAELRKLLIDHLDTLEAADNEDEAIAVTLTV
jgi:hypothetical protein